ncbi:hypothetical protein LUZ63_002020 [Rhynchospora breviuscula]|uniref:DUF4378 domain-containing protein n=1 Tax=Rhynchospora breviuscula TaxID=2022672 RepID=A0A9Q0CY05_9POAL|nr:hypothetical protein LUZ63_002020 [Rhynchospora breviuscula]
MSNKPLMLKDYLEQDSNWDSIDEFSRYASMRHLLELELRGGRQLIRTRSKNALLKLSSLIKLDFLLLSCSPSSINKRSRFRNFSKKNQSTGSFWKKRGSEVERKGTGDVRVKDIVRLRSFNLPTSPLASSSSSSSSSSSWSESDCTGSDFLPSSNGSAEFIPDIEPNCTGADEKCSPVRTETSHGGSEKKVGTSETTGSNSEEEEKDQLSPVSIMDFPYEEEEIEEEESISDSSFHANLASVERAKQALLQKIRRFESLAELVPVDLDEQFSTVDEGSCGNPASDDDDDDDVNEEEISVEVEAWELLDHIKSNSSIRIEGCIEKLLLEFLIEGLNCNTQIDSLASTELVNAAREWIESRSHCWEQRDCRGEMEVGQMDWNGRWRCFEEEQQELAVCLTSGVFGSLMDELVGEMVLC